MKIPVHIHKPSRHSFGALTGLGISPTYYKMYPLVRDITIPTHRNVMNIPKPEYVDTRAWTDTIEEDLSGWTPKPSLLTRIKNKLKKER